MQKPSKTFRLDPETIALIHHMTELLGKSQSDVIKIAMLEAFGEHQQEQRILMKVHSAASKGVEYLHAVKNNQTLLPDQFHLFNFLKEVRDKAEGMPQFLERN